MCSWMVRTLFVVSLIVALNACMRSLVDLTVIVPSRALVLIGRDVISVLIAPVSCSSVSESGGHASSTILVLIWSRMCCSASSFHCVLVAPSLNRSSMSRYDEKESDRCVCAWSYFGMMC